MARFDDILELISDAQEREAIKKSLEKHPEAKKALDKVEALANDGSNYNEWYAKQWPEYDKRFKDAPKLQADLEAANKIIESLKAAKPAAPAKEEVDVGDMTIEQIEARMMQRIKEGGFITAAEANRIADEKATAAAAAAQGRVYTHGLPMVERMMTVQDKYRKDFGKEMDRAAFGKFIEDNKFSDVDKAFEAFTRDAYVDKIKVEAFAAGEAKGAKDTAERMGKEASENAMRSLPTDMGGSNGFTSRPGAAPEPVAMKDIPDNYQLGQRGGFKLAHAVAAKIEADRAAGKLTN